MQKINTNLENKNFHLAVDTSGRVGSLALARESQVLYKKQFTGPLRHGAELFPTIEQAIEITRVQIEDIGYLHITAGPGSFTGIRMAVTLAKMMSLANLELKILAVSTLAALAENALNYMQNSNLEINRLAVVLDAKRGSFYIALFKYDNNRLIRETEDMVMTAADFLKNFAKKQDKIWLLGEGLVYYRKDFTAEGVDFLPEQYWTVRAENLLKAGQVMINEKQFAAPLNLRPYYLRKPEAKLKKKKG